jgi:hypothetical protein
MTDPFTIDCPNCGFPLTQTLAQPFLEAERAKLQVALIAGAANGVPDDAMAYSSRDAKFVMNVHGRWDSASEDEKRYRVVTRVLQSGRALCFVGRLRELHDRRGG